MPVLKTVGLVLIVLGVVEAILGQVVIAPRVQDPSKRQLISMVVLLSGVTTTLLGLLFFFGILPPGD